MTTNIKSTHGTLSMRAEYLDHRNIGAVVTLEEDGIFMAGRLDSVHVTRSDVGLNIGGQLVSVNHETPVKVNLSRSQVSGKSSSESLMELADMLQDLTEHLLD